jgi:hypothetical protein
VNHASLEELVRLQGATAIRGVTPRRRVEFWNQFRQKDGSYLIHSPLWSEFNEDCISWSAAEHRPAYDGSYPRANPILAIIIAIVATAIGLYLIW